MPIALRLSTGPSGLNGSIILEPSKSISNRALIIRSLCEQPFEIHNLSTSDDTQVLEQMLASTDERLYAGYAGSSYRFMLARACLFDRPVLLDAATQLRRRPIGPLVRALQQLGADIAYAEKDGFPPLLIKPATGFGKTIHEIHLQAGVSSQYVSALLMIAPMMPNGLILHLQDDPVSLSYIRMTLSMMRYFGIDHAWKGNTISIQPGAYIAKPFTVEGDWSGASYLYSFVALADKAQLTIQGLSENSIQGDVVVNKMYRQLGVDSVFTGEGVQLTKIAQHVQPKEFGYDFSMCPDIAQTVMVTLAGLGIKGLLSGLKTLRIKETDRLHAMQTELARVKVNLDIREGKDNISAVLTGRAKWKDRGKFDTYGDHRMAMSFAPLASIDPVIIKQPDVVSKSYPHFWEDLVTIGVKKEEVKVK